jgi:hypothetical protein
LAAGDIVRLIGASNTVARSGIEFESPDVDFLAATEAIAVFIPIDSAERLLDFDQLLLAPARRFQRHLLALHRVHAGDASDPRLIQFDSTTLFRQSGFQLKYFLFLSQ